MDILDFSRKPFGDVNKMHCIYILRAIGTDFYKIGFAKNLKQRISNLQSGCPFRINLVNCSNVPNHREIEAFLHKKYSDFKMHGEWFELSDSQISEILDFFDDIGTSIRMRVRGK